MTNRWQFWRRERDYSAFGLTLRARFTPFRGSAGFSPAVEPCLLMFEGSNPREINVSA
jgi:hypothetical protein